MGSTENKRKCQKNTFFNMMNWATFGSSSKREEAKKREKRESF
jgi:hypothetical protein